MTSFRKSLCLVYSSNLSKMYKPTKAEINEFKKKHGRIFKITAGDKCCLVKTPNRSTIARASIVGEKNPVKFNETILKDCFIAGDEELKTDDSYFLGASKQIKGIIDIKESSLEEL